MLLLFCILLKFRNRIEGRLKCGHLCYFFKLFLVTLFFHPIYVFNRKLLDVARYVHLPKNIVVNLCILVLFVLSTVYNVFKNRRKVRFFILNAEVCYKFICFLGSQCVEILFTEEIIHN